MNEFTAKNGQAFLDACGAIGVEPNAMIEPHKERYLVSEFLKDPVWWLETELLYYSCTTPGEAQEVANNIDRFINEGENNGRRFNRESGRFNPESGKRRVHETLQ